MADERVELSVGPIDGDLAREWLSNSRTIVGAVRRHRLQLSVRVEEPLLDLIDAALVVWLDFVGDGATFSWSSAVDIDQVVALAGQWQALASLTEDDLVLLGCRWADPRTLPFFEALVAGFASALKSLPSTAAMGHALEEHPPGR